MKFLKLFPINLMLFGVDSSEEGASGTFLESNSRESGDYGKKSEGFQPKNSSEGTEIEEEEARKSGSRRRTKSENTVIYGKQPDAQSAESETENGDNSENDEVSLDEQFDAIIKGDFKEAYDKKVQSHIKHRLGDVKKIETENKEMKAVIDVLAQRYGIDNPSDILKRLEDDSRLWEDAAEEAGLTVEQYKEMQGLKRENSQYRAQEIARSRAQEAQKIYDGWLDEANQVKQRYPNFNLEDEIKNPDFRGLIQNNIPMEKAYETIHLNEIVQGVSEFSARRAEENAVLKIQNRKARPKENIASSSSGVIIKDDPSKFTAKDRAEIIKRAARGEIITL